MKNAATKSDDALRFRSAPFPAFSFIESDAPDMRTLRADDAGQALAAEFFLGGFSADPTNPTPRSSR
jgi:hypothetical protein